MILDVFIVLIVIALSLIGFGLYFADMRFLSIVGCIFLFILAAFVILPNKLQYQSGNIVTDNGSTSNIVYTYNYYNDDTTHYVGYFLSIVSFLAIFIIPIVEPRREE